MATRTGSKDALPGDILLVVHDFIARSPDELSLAKGDRVSLMEGDSEFGDGWFLGKHLTNGTTGLFPEVYTTPAPKGTLNNTAKPRINDLLTTSPVSGALTPSTAPITGPPPTAHLRSTVTSVPQPAASQQGLRNATPTTATNTRSFTVTSDSPVMSETLSVIDEHMSDMKAPRSPHSQSHKRDTLSSVYSANQASRRSYIAGHETDEEEQGFGEGEVMSWNPDQVSEYLADHGVEQAHCDVFREQDISGEVLLGLDQNSLFIKEFDLGSVGRRLKTWHKIKALQDEVRRSANAQAAGRDDAGSLLRPGSSQEVHDPRHRASSAGAVLPRALTTSRRVDGNEGPSRLNSTAKASPAVQPPASTVVPSDIQGVIPRSLSRPDSFYRPSAQTIRDMNHARRHSSIDSTSTDGAARYPHRKQPSIDTTWQPGQLTNSTGRGHAYSGSIDSQYPQRKPSLLVAASPNDIDRGYFSSNEVEARPRKANVLQKRLSTAAPSPTHSRASSVLDLGRSNGQLNRHSYVADPRDSGSTVNSAAPLTTAAGLGASKTIPVRSSTSPELPSKSIATSAGLSTPMVTKLDQNAKTFPIAAKDSSEMSGTTAVPGPSSVNQSFFSAARAKVPGLRSISDAVTRNEKSVAPPKSSHKDSSINSPTTPGSSTASTHHPSMELAKVDSHSRVSTGSGGAGSGNVINTPIPSTKRPRAKTKTKKDTSAYTRGLEKKPPAEQMQDCDYSGWMKKKSSSLMTTWKPRLFVLRGRRLSYYYAEDDTEEKGLIDISFHRVLPAHHEMLTGFHATVTGASSSTIQPISHSSDCPTPNIDPSTSPSATNSTTTTPSLLPPTVSQQNLLNNPDPLDSSSGLFIFKLVPPKAGLSKGVNFTKPTVHYFAVNSRHEGRLWMAALMKATIDRDDQSSVTTTYNQKTISLAKARARRERPPALREDSIPPIPSVNPPDDNVAPAPSNLTTDPLVSEAGLGISSAVVRDSSHPSLPDRETSTSLDPSRFHFPEDASSLAPSTNTNTTTTDRTFDDEVDDGSVRPGTGLE